MTSKSIQPPGAVRRDANLPVKIPGSLSLVLPAHNEAENIEIVVGDAITVLPTYADVFEIIVVDDGSRDRTAEIIDSTLR